VNYYPRTIDNTVTVHETAEPISIGFDLTALLPEPSGVDIYLLQLVRHLAKVDRENLYTVFINREDRNRGDIQLGSNFQVRALCLRPRAVRLMFQQVTLPAIASALNFDVIHSPSFLAPFLQGRQRHLLSVHDMTFFTMPAVHSRLRRSRGFRWAVLKSICRAHLINVPSASARVDLLNGAPGVSPERVRITPYGINACFSPAPDADVQREKRRLGLPDRYILFVGNIEPRKNLEVLLDAYRGLIATGAPEHLVLAGKQRQVTDGLLRKLKSPEFAGRVHLTGFVAADDLPWIYRGARLFVYPSLYEGFGFPPLEAMACGIPTVATTSSSLIENLRGAAELAPPTDDAALCVAMQRLLADERLRNERRRMGLKRAAGFRWEHTARGVLDCYRELAVHKLIHQ